MLPDYRRSGHARESSRDSSFEARREDDINRIVLKTTLKSITKGERFLLCTLFVHCVGLAATAVLVAALGAVDEEFDALDSPDAALANVSISMRVLTSPAMKGQSAVFCVGLLWVCLTSLIAVSLAILNEAEELDFALTWLAQLMLLAADVAARLRAGDIDGPVREIAPTFQLQRYAFCRLAGFAWTRQAHGSK